MELPAAYGKYHLLEKLATGGMAEVFLAKSFGAAGFERLLAVKKILPHMAEDQEFITMFVDEARIASTLNHSNVVQINELGKEANCYYIAMEFVFGKDMAKIFDRLRDTGQTMPIPLAALIVSRICEGLDYAHRKHDAGGKHLNIIHRDVSPGNVLISYDGDVKIIDFGIAKARNRRGETVAGTLKGKFGYMSPEQVRGVRLDHRTDIFTVGILLYELLTGERLFGGASDMGTLEKVRSAVIPAPSDINSKIPFKLEQVILKALARDPDKRYTWANELQEELARFLMFDGTLVTTKTLARYMRELFAPEIAAENERMAVYRRRGYPWVDEALAKTDAPARVQEPVVPQPQEPAPQEPAPRQPQGQMPYLGDTEADEDEETEVLDPDEVWKSMPAPNPVVVQEEATVVVHNLLEVEQTEDYQRTLPPVPPSPTNRATEDGSSPSPASRAASPSMGNRAEAGRVALGGEEDEADETVREGLDQEARPTQESKKARRKRAATEPVPERVPVTDRAAVKPRKRSLSALVAILAFLAGLGVAGVVGYFVFLHKSSPSADSADPGEAADDPAPPPEVAGKQPAPAEEQKEKKEPVAAKKKKEPKQEPAPEKKPPRPAAPKVAKAEPAPVAKKPDPPRKEPRPKPRAVVRKPPRKKPPKTGAGEVDSREVVEEPVQPEKKPRREKKVARAKGPRLVVESTPPGARILLNGKKSGTTPATLDHLKINQAYFVVLKKDGYKNFLKGIKFKNPRTIKLQAKLRARSGSQPPPAPAKTAAAAPPARADKPKGYLIANTKPWARVIVDGKDTGLWTPIPRNKKIPLSPGRHTVLFKTREGQTLKVPIIIQPGKTAKLIRKIP